MGRLLIAAGIVLIIAGVFVMYVGKLPGDIRIEGKHGTFYFPIVTCIVISIILSLINYLFRK